MVPVDLDTAGREGYKRHAEPLILKMSGKKSFKKELELTVCLKISKSTSLG
jgi:hypothetical protein